MRLTADHRKKVVNIPPRYMMSTITPQIVDMITEEQNKQQYESFVTSCINNGSLDMIVGYREWLSAVRAYKPQLPNTEAEYTDFYEAINRFNRVTTVSVDTVRKVLKNEN